MEQAVAERPFTQEYHANQHHAWRNGPEGVRGSYPLQDPSQNRDPRRWTGSFNGEDTRDDKSRAPLCRDYLRGKCTRGSSCKYLHQQSGFVNHDGATFRGNSQQNLGPVAEPRNMQLYSANEDADFSRRRPCRNYQSGRCFRGSTCMYLHTEFTNGETIVDDASRRPFFREGRERSPCRKFQSGRCDRGSTCRYLHSEVAISDRPVQGWNADQQHHGAVASGNFDNNRRMPQVNDAANNEYNNTRFPLPNEYRSRSPCRNFLQGRCHFGASCRRWHPPDAFKNNLTPEQQPRVTENANNHGFGDGRSALSSRERIESNQQNNLRTASFSGDPRGRPACQYFHRGSNYQGAPSENLRPATIYHRTRYDLGEVRHQGVSTASRDPSFDRGNVVREVYSHGMRPHQDTHVGLNGSLNDRGASTHYNPETINGASRSWSLERKRIRPASDVGGYQQQPEVCLKFTKGRCDQGGNCRYLHSFHEYASSISHQTQKSHLEATADLTNVGQPNQSAETTEVYVPDTSRDADVNLWSQPYKRQRTSNGFHFAPEDNARYRTLRQDYSQDNYNRSRSYHVAQNQLPDRRPYNRYVPATGMNNVQHCNVTATFATPVHGDTNSCFMAPDGHGEVLSNEHTLRLTGQNGMESVNDSMAVNIAGRQTSINQEHYISEARAAFVLGNSESAGAKVDSSDTSLQCLPTTSSMEGTSLDHKSFTLSSVVSDNISRDVPVTDDIGVVLANKRPFEEPVAAVNGQMTIVDMSPATTGNGIVVSDAINGSLTTSQLSDAGILKSKRKLLVLDVNGLLADIVAEFPDTYKPDAMVAGKGVFKRPFCDEFLRFCFEKFDVGIWSSRTEKNVTRVLECLMEDTMNKLLFCWHQSHCTQTGYRTVENNKKPLVLKELKKLWEKEEEGLPWNKGFYDESNTILLDDSPYKALRNPPFTAIFPFPYSFRHAVDKSLGPDGELRLYLERLAEAENVQKFIQENPFGQRPITKSNLSWAFYSKIVGEPTGQQKAISSSHGEPRLPYIAPPFR